MQSCTIRGGGVQRPHGSWYDNVEVHSYYSRGEESGYGVMDPKHQIDDGYNLQHIYEADHPVFRKLIDHPSWFDLVEYYMGAGTPFMHE
jgi:hypothetical protein